MNILPIRTALLHRDDDIASQIQRTGLLEADDLIVISSKVISVVEGSAVDLTTIIPTELAIDYAEKTGLEPRFAQVILDETRRMHGEVLGYCAHAILTSLRPQGMKHGRILCPNAGVDLSNAEEGFALPWPRDPVASLQKLYTTLGVPMIISDSCCHAGRLGVTAFALAVAGFEPIESRVEQKDLYGRMLRITKEAIADQLATAANAVMGNGAECIPAAVIRDHGATLSSYVGWVDGIEPEEDLFRGG